MKKKLCIAAAAAAVIGAWAAAQQPTPKPTEPPQGQRQVIIGEVIDIAGYMMEDMRGADHLETLQYRFEKGLPVGILQEETDLIFIPIFRSSEPASPLENAREQLKPLVGKKVVTSGNVWRKNGTNFIRMQVISEY